MSRVIENLFLDVQKILTQNVMFYGYNCEVKQYQNAENNITVILLNEY